MRVQTGYRPSRLLTSRVYPWTRSRVLLMQAAHQEPKLMIWLQLSAWSMNRNKDIVHDLVATTDMHHRPVWAHTQRPGKGLQAKQSWKVCTPKTRPYRSQIFKKDLKKKKVLIMCLTVYHHPYALNHIQLLKWAFNSYEVSIFRVSAMIYHQFHVEK